MNALNDIDDYLAISVGAGHGGRGVFAGAAHPIPRTRAIADEWEVVWDLCDEDGESAKEGMEYEMP